MQSNKLKLKPVVVLLASLFATGAFAQDEAVVQTESVSVLGQGQSRQVQTINSEDMKKVAAGPAR
jgi:hypothetical protein